MQWQEPNKAQKSNIQLENWNSYDLQDLWEPQSINLGFKRKRAADQRGEGEVSRRGEGNEWQKEGTSKREMRMESKSQFGVRYRVSSVAGANWIRSKSKLGPAQREGKRSCVKGRISAIQLQLSLLKCFLTWITVYEPNILGNPIFTT